MLYFFLDEMKSQTLLLIAIVAAFVVASESDILKGGGCPKCHRKDSSGRCRKILGCSRKREFLKKFYEMLQDMPRNNMEELEDYIPEDY